MCAAAEAMVKLFAGANGKAGRFFFVERATRHVVGAAFFQWNVLVYHVHDVGFGEQFVDEFVRYHKNFDGCTNKIRTCIHKQLFDKF